MDKSSLLRKKLLSWYLDNGVYYSINEFVRDIHQVEKQPKANQGIKENYDKKIEIANDFSTTNVKATDLKSLFNESKKFDGCPLKRTAKNFVFSDGNPHSKVMLLGEAPGEEEDRIGRPFVGTAGKLLDKMLLAIDQDRNNTYLSNIVFWRPPGNRNPTQEEIDSCLPFVLKHIEIIRPRILVLAGAIPAKSILNNSDLGITKLRGNWYDLKFGSENFIVKTMPIFHPAFLLRQPARKKEAWEDLKKIRNEIQKIT